MRTVGNGARTEGGQGGQHGTIGSEKKQGPRQTLGNNLAGDARYGVCFLRMRQLALILPVPFGIELRPPQRSTYTRHYSEFGSVCKPWYYKLL